jgi:hypothetical protein
MFDTPDLGPLCAAPFIAAFVGMLIFGFGSIITTIIEKKTGKKPSWGSPIIWLCCLVFIPSSCCVSIGLEIGASSPAPWFEPNTDNVVGEWKLSPETVRMIEANPHWLDIPLPAQELIFKDDGTFLLENIPSFWLTWDKTKIVNEKYFSGSGTWYLGQMVGTERNEWVVFARFQMINGHSDNRLMRFYFEGHLPPYKLVTLDGNRFFFCKD